MERREDLVKVDGISFEDPLQLRGRDSGWGIVSDFDVEFRFGDISVI
jgi:hypothetical protein